MIFELFSHLYVFSGSTMGCSFLAMLVGKQQFTIDPPSLLSRTKISAHQFSNIYSR